MPKSRSRRNIEWYMREVGKFGGHFGTITRFVKSTGSWMPKGAPLSQEQWGFLSDLNILDCDHELGQCWYNAQALLIDANIRAKGRIKYWEGYASTELGLALDHGWCTLDGMILDLTWPLESDPNVLHKNWTMNRAFGRVPYKWAYFGVEVVIRDVALSWVDDKVAGPCLPMLYVLRTLGVPTPERTIDARC